MAQHSSSGCQLNFEAWYKEWTHGTVAPHEFQQTASPIVWRRPSHSAQAHILVASTHDITSTCQYSLSMEATFFIANFLTTINKST